MEKEAPDLSLLAKYNKPVPRYTSYPPVPFWNDSIDTERWVSSFRESFARENPSNGIAVYIHLPFCESLCTYCGCNKQITTNHSVEEQYIEAVQKEWKLYRKLMKQTPVIRELHLGGGTPTFFSPANLQRLIQFILKDSIIHPRYCFSIEGHPLNTTEEHLRVLAGLGFHRISFGVQDNDPHVQRVINRIQPLQTVIDATARARAHRFTSVNFDLIYGLPLQTAASIEKTIKEVIAIQPDRIAFYSYAHVPWTSRAQRLFSEADLPSPEAKMELYTIGKALFAENGYTDIGMDHYALPSDDLYKAWKKGRLHRNFMGYTIQPTELLLGLGVSSISDTGNAFAQNEKKLHNYYAALNNETLPIRKGYFLSNTDQRIKKHILNISCQGYTPVSREELYDLGGQVGERLTELQNDGLIDWLPGGVRVTGAGRFFIRNICAAFDQYLGAVKSDDGRFSKSV